jgi:hypothetical protein
MRKLTSLIVVGLLAVAAPAMAQTADPLGLIASGAVIPYVGAAGILTVNSGTGAFGPATNTGSLAILEVASPVGSNAGPEESIFGSKQLHMFFYDQTCVRQGPSVGNPLTVNDADLLNLNLIGGIPQAGLVAMGAVDQTGGVLDVLQPLSNAIHARVYWINAVDGILSRVLEPISIRNPEAISLNRDWNPLRTGATFVAPLEGSGVRSVLYLVCPTQQIIPGAFPTSDSPPYSTTTATNAVISPQTTTIPTAANGTVPFASSGTAFLNGTDAFTYTGVTTSSFTGVSGIGGVYGGGTFISPTPIVPPSLAFPALHPTPVQTGATPLFLRVYDDEENFRRNVDVFCRCWGAHPVADIDSIYSSADPVVGAPRGTYTEMEGKAACETEDECSFTGYRAIRWGAGNVGNDVWGRLSNGSFLSLQGLPPVDPFPGFAVPVR